MIPHISKNHGPWGMFTLSLACHLMVFAFIVWTASPKFHPAAEPVTYVDMVSPPVSSPQGGNPLQAKSQAAKPQSAKPQSVKSQSVPVPVQPRVSTLLSIPFRTPVAARDSRATATRPNAVSATNPNATKPESVEDGRDFAERMAKLQQQSEDKRLAEVLDRLHKRSGKVAGMPSAKGTQAGSDYSSYIQSRLKDAFRKVIASGTKAPQVLIRIAIGPDGRVAAYHVEKYSGDPVFDEAVSRAVTLAGRSFKPPPGGVPFERVFRFKPEGVGLS